VSQNTFRPQKVKENPTVQAWKHKARQLEKVEATHCHAAPILKTVENDQLLHEVAHNLSSSVIKLEEQAQHQVEQFDELQRQNARLEDLVRQLKNALPQLSSLQLI